MGGCNKSCRFIHLSDIFSKFQDKKEPHSPATVIVNIDDKSLKYLGQWPWPRIIEAKLINIIDFYHHQQFGVIFISRVG